MWYKDLVQITWRKYYRRGSGGKEELEVTWVK
jgi:hypothetical protein